MKMNQVMLIAGLAVAGLGGPNHANAEPSHFESSSGSITNEDKSGLLEMSQEQLIDHLVQSAELGCRCCGRCHC